MIPHSNKVKLEFENVYIKNPVEFKDRNIHRQISPGVYMYMESYNNVDNIGYRFSLERIEDGKRVWFLNSDRIVWDSTASRWKIENYYIRRITGFRETLTNGWQLDTTLSIKPADFRRRLNIVDAMDTPALSAFIEEEKISGSESINSYLVEKYRRIALPFSTFILMLIGVSFPAGRCGRNRLSTWAGDYPEFRLHPFHAGGEYFRHQWLDPAMIAVWIPNIVFAFVAVYLLRVALNSS